MNNVAIISVVGDGMRTLKGISARFFSALTRGNINIVAIAQGSSERSISAVIANDAATNAVRLCHQMLFNTNQIVEVFIVGVGGVGRRANRADPSSTSMAKKQTYRPTCLWDCQFTCDANQYARYRFR
ncbi:bifunctional aspartokinase I/homoserine dehydrogenase I [Proteus mirabilis]|uniref:aspartate kinase n=1 Tax=Proteus mirabilis TaxID=584 RepID=A0A2X2BJL9_PROMI|nr:bifunctional aspartokinase I/homoserine dehydrogenase I [Proteus mirabilis]